MDKIAANKTCLRECFGNYKDVFLFFLRLFVTNQLAWLELPVTPYKVSFLFVSSTLQAVAATGRKLLTKVFLVSAS